ncbi:O-antigen ligase family protein [Xanthomarina spongicola]|uniref:O-antigen ligase-like membrane protein n=1 Tax=Xanthomarina spongicola TaxID=570520 RepID=A0A316DKI0_9FLAO|nr:O-antigen ligase family protein [Xanthomarina spongicola]PWK18012.1 O-antigen ligase-like membrane protein [Xanthomarina spongicola]
MILIPLLILFVIILVRFQKGMFAAFLVLVATKSVIDAFWEYQIGPFSILAIQGFLVPVLFFDVFKRRKIVPKFWNITAKIYLLAMSLGIIWGFVEKPIGVFQNAFLSFNSYLGFFLIPLLITKQSEFRKLLIVIMICGIFPIMISLFQFQTGIIFQERETIGMTRYVGFYHDAFPVRFYGLMTLLVILIYNSIFKTKSFLLKGFMALMSIGAFFSIYLVFSKAAVGIIGLWIVILLLFSKSKIKQVFSIIIGLSVILIVFGDTFFDSIEQLFSKEIGYESGEVKDARYTLAGRGYIWQEAWDFWTTKQSVFFQWVGDGLQRPVHNEFLRVLLANGIIGLILLVIFVFTMLKNVFKIHKNIRIFGLMLFGMYLIDCIGLVPGVYYYYNILVWGIIGLLLLRKDLFVKQY